MVWVTADTHGYIDIDKITAPRWPESVNLKKKDYLIICGDWGVIWDGGYNEKWWIQWYNSRPFTTCVCLGNHECFPLIDRYPIVDFLGGKARKISDSIYVFMQGEIYTIEGKKFFSFGKAKSHDVQFRTEGIDWWPEEVPSNREYNNALNNLDLHHHEVDYIISHCAPSSILYELSKGAYFHDEITQFLQVVKETTKFDKWFFGHYHIDWECDAEKFVCLYNRVLRVL